MNKIMFIAVVFILMACSNSGGVAKPADQVRAGAVVENLVVGYGQNTGSPSPYNSVIRIQDGCRVIYITNMVNTTGGLEIGSSTSPGIAVSDVDCK